jgi:hypothetical protein
MAALREAAIEHHRAGHVRPRLLECRHELDLQREISTPDEHPMLTSDTQLHLELVQHHLQTLPGTTQSHCTKSGGCCLHFARVLLAPSLYKHYNLQSGGRTHAHGMASQLLCGFIAQQCSVLASFSLTVLFISKAGPRAAGEMMTLSPRGPEGLQTCT